MGTYLSLSQKAFTTALDKLAQEIRELVKSAGEAYIAKTNSDLLNAKIGDTILGLRLVYRDGSRVGLEYRSSSEQGFALLRIEIDNQLNTGPTYFVNPALKALMGEISISKKGSYEVVIGYGFDGGKPPYDVARAKIALKNPDLSIDAFLAGAPDTGFVVDFGIGTSNNGSSKFPLIIPLGPSGFALQGIGGTFADNFRPNLFPDGSKTEPGRPNAIDYVNWAQVWATRALDAWRPIRAGEGNTGGVGLRTDIIDLATSGALIRIKDAGFLALADGPVVVQGGRGRILSLPPDKFRFDLISALDFSSLSYAVQGAASFKLPGDEDATWELLSATGSITAQISLRDSRAWFLNLGTDSAPISGKFLKDVFQASVFCMTNFDRIYVGARVQFGGRQLDILGIKLDAHFGMDTRALLGFQPIHFRGTLSLFGGVTLQVWKFRIGIEVSGNISLEILKPFALELTLDWRLDLPWPLKDISGTITIFNYSNFDLPKIARPILLMNAAELTGGEFGGLADTPNQRLGAIHVLSGLQFNLDKSDDAIWPDCELALPFSRKLIDSTSKILSPPVLPYLDGAVQVAHYLTQLDLVRVNQTTGEETQVSFSAVWIVGPVAAQGQMNSTTARLHFPANDPFRWLDQFQNRDISTTPLPPQGIELDFGIGRSEYGLSTYSVSTLTVSSSLAFGGLNVGDNPAFGLPLRCLRFSNASFQINNPEDHSPRLISRAVLTFVSFKRDVFYKLKSDHQLNLVSAEQSNTSAGKLLYFVRVEVIANAALDFSSFQISFSDEGNCEWTGSGGPESCRPQISLYKIALFDPAKSDVTWNDTTILQPGAYKVKAQGNSAWSSHGQTKTGAWSFEQAFRIIPPLTIRPYIAYVAIGDERPYRLRGLGMWNPTPSGLGFPRYKNHLAAIVFRPDYFHKIFPSLIAHFTDMRSANTVAIAKSALGERFESASSARWVNGSNGHYDVADEMLFSVPEGKGLHELELGYIDPIGSVGFPVYVKLDKWPFQTSQFGDPATHLVFQRPTVVTSRDHGGLQSFSGSSDIVNADLSAVKSPAAEPVSVPSDWRVPPTFIAQSEHFAPQATLQFLRFIQRTGIKVTENNSDYMYGVVDCANASRIEAFSDLRGRPYALWLRTPEPFDWRRLQAQASVYVVSPDNTALDVSRVPTLGTLEFMPSPDGASALVLLSTASTYVRFPRGLFRITASYSLVSGTLPSLRDPSVTGASQTFEFRFFNSFGENAPW